MSFFIRTKLKNIYRSIELSDKEVENKDTLLETIISKGKRTYTFQNKKRIKKKRKCVEFFSSTQKARSKR